jgi:hypothetical protein
MRDDIRDGIGDGKAKHGAHKRDEKALHNRLEVVRFEKSNDTLPVFVEERFNVIKRKFARIVRKSVIQYDKKWNDYKRKQK